MIKNILFKTIAVTFTMVFFMSCDNDVIEDTGGLINNENFEVSTISITPKVTSFTNQFVQTGGIEDNLIGIYKQPVFGEINTSIVSQISISTLNTTDATLPVNRLLGTVNLEGGADDIESKFLSAELVLPFVINSTTEGETTTRSYNNFIGDAESELTIKVETFDNFLHRFNGDASNRIYYSNGVNNDNINNDLLNLTTLQTQSFTVKKIVPEEDNLTINLDDTFSGAFFDKLIDGESIKNFEDLSLLFKGFKISTELVSGDGFVLPVDMSKAQLNITYTNTGISKETQTTEVLTNTIVFDLSNGVKYGLYENTAGLAATENQVHVHGINGYQASIDVSDVLVNRTSYKNENWLINEARLRVYVDESVTIDENELLNNLYIYVVTKDDENEVIRDYNINSFENSVGGTIQYVDNENKTQPYLEFLIVNEMKDLLENDDVKAFRIKSRVNNETTFIDFRSSNPKGIVLLNEKSNLKPELEIIYSRIK